ncbi:MAG TPA: 3'-5' exonuclease [Acidobacteriota bacterium]|nr:3'-5' exonuclease [Acidobacteriota bacterium]
MRDYPQHRLVKLEQNYRSTKTIIKAAQAVITRNAARVKKELWTENASGEPIEVYHATDEYDEATFVTLRVMAALKDVSPSGIAVLYRANAQSRALEESFVKAQIPHRIVGAVGFYERREIKDALAYLRLLANPDDASSFFRVVNVPARGVGKKMIQQIQEESERKGVSPFQAAGSVGGAALKSFLALFQPSLHQLTPSTFLEELLGRIGYVEHLRKEDPESLQDRQENIAEFLSFLRERESEPEFSLMEFLASLPLDSGTKEEPGEAVTLLTVHSAKGLEFRALFVVGLEEGLFPHARSLESSEDVEEERRLFYVAMTRAKERLTLSWAQSRGMFGAGGSGRPSRFLEEVPDWFKVTRISERFGSLGPARREAAWRSGTVPRSTAQDPTSPYRIGGRVRHDKLGLGTVVNVEGAPGDWKLTIRFPTGVKKILTKYAQLTVET